MVGSGSRIPTSKGGYWIQVKYGDDGWALKIRHETNHGNEGEHSDPHDHIPKYDPNTHAPLWKESEQINYEGEVPEFKRYGGNMEKLNWGNVDGIITNLVYDEEALRFKTISEFKDVMRRGAEVNLEWNGIEYFTSFKHDSEKRMVYYICQCGSAEVNRATQMETYDLDELLEYKFGEDRLRDIITKVIVVDRTL